MQRQKSASSCGRNVSIQMRKKTKGENNIKAKYVICIIGQFIKTINTIMSIIEILKVNRVVVAGLVLTNSLLELRILKKKSMNTLAEP